MQDVMLLLPKHKHDIASVVELSRLGYPTIASVLPALMEWIQDPNWPVASYVADLLVSIGEPTIPHLTRILHGDDGVWKHSCIECVVKRFPYEIIVLFRSELMRIVNAPSEDDVLEEVHLVAGEALAEMECYRYPIYGGGIVVQAIAKTLGVAWDMWMQDWPIEVADANRVEEFISLYERETSAAVRLVIAELIVASLDDAVACEIELVMDVWRKAGIILKKYPHIMKYWSCSEAVTDDEMFRITHWIRALDTGEI